MHGLALFLYMGVKYSLTKSLSQRVPAPCNPIQYQVDNNLWHLSLSLLSPYFRKDSSYLGVGNQLCALNTPINLHVIPCLNITAL